MIDLAAHSDEQLAALLKDGDETAFNEIFNRFNRLLYTTAFKLTGEADAAKDMVQEVFISLWEKRARLTLRSTLAAYLHSAVRYKFYRLAAVGKLRDDYARELVVSLEGGAESGDQRLLEKDLIGLLESFAASLPGNMGTILLRSKVQGYSNQEIADELGLSEKSIRNQLSLAVGRFRAFMGFMVLVIIYLLCG